MIKIICKHNYSNTTFFSNDVKVEQLCRFQYFSHRNIINNVLLFIIPHIIISISAPVLPIYIAPKPVWTDTVHPLAVYEATWLQSNSNYKETSIHISLIERKCDSFVSQFWLRIGSVSVFSQYHNGSEESELDVLGFLSNNVAKLLIHPCKDWIDLDKVKNDKYV